jgi:HK97 family phage portal protein
LIDRSKKVKIESHPILNILNSPNPDETSISFLEALMSYKQISGNSYIAIIKDGKSQPKELYNLRPDRVTLETDRKGNKIGYNYEINNNKHLFPIDKITGDCDILHLKNFNPLDDYFGMSSVEAAAYSIDQHNNASQWNQSLLQNGAKPCGALVVKSGKDGHYKDLTDEQFSRLKEQFEANYSGAANSGKPLLLEGGLDWKEMSLSPKDMDFLESKNNSAREIALAFGVPPQLLGIPGDNTYSNLAEARLALWEQTILPIMDDLALSLDSWLVKKYPNSENIKLTYSKDNISALIPRRESKWQRVSNATFLSDQEKRDILSI